MRWEEHLDVRGQDLVEKAVLAPSSHNTQPWIFRVTDDGIELIADRTRALPVNDPEDRELVMSCGAALFNLRVAASAKDLASSVSILPDSSHPDLLARITFSPLKDGESLISRLAEAVEQRRTYRKTFEKKKVDEESLQHLTSAAGEEAVTWVPVQEPALRAQIAELVAEGDSIQWSNPSWRRELAAWMHPRRKGDGLTVPALAAPIARVVIRTFDMGGGVAAKDQDLAEESPLLAVLGTDADEVRDWMSAGQGLERILLAGTWQGLQASYLNQPVQVPALRSKLASMMGIPFPQAILRFGYPTEELDAAPRRPVGEVLEFAEKGGP